MNPIRRHRKVALQFSGGKDSLAVAQMLRFWSHKVVVYWAKVPNQFPETLAAVAWCKEIFPHFVEVDTQVAGIASDIVPSEASAFGRSVSGSILPPLMDRYECCYRTLMLPLAQRMMLDGITLIVRGQKNADRYRGPLFSGSKVDGIEYWYPLQDWSDAQVFEYLEGANVPIPSFYPELKGGLDCPGCSAWLPEKRMAWLLKTHPLVAETVTQKLRFIESQVRPTMDELQQELNNGSR